MIRFYGLSLRITIAIMLGSILIWACFKIILNNIENAGVHKLWKYFNVILCCCSVFFNQK